MSELEALSARIDALEMRVAYQDKTIDDLNKAVVDQWKLIDALTRQLASLAERVQEAEENAGPAAQDRPPPHY
jgi:SlyX protein